MSEQSAAVLYGLAPLQWCIKLSKRNYQKNEEGGGEIKHNYLGLLTDGQYYEFSGNSNQSKVL